MCEREHLASYTFKEAFPEADILWFREFCWEETSKQKLKKQNIYRDIVPKWMGCVRKLNRMIMSFENLHFSVLQFYLLNRI